jgi:hypothetical protein
MHTYIKSTKKIKNEVGNSFRCVYYRVTDNKIEKNQKFIKQNNKYLQIGGDLKPLSVLKDLPYRNNVKKLPSLSNKPQLPNINKIYSLNVLKKPNKLSPIINTRKNNLNNFNNSDFTNGWNATAKTSKLSLRNPNKRLSNNNAFTNINNDTYNNSNANSFTNSLNNAIERKNSNSFKSNKSESAMDEFDRKIREKKKNNPKYLENVQEERKNRIKSYNINYKDLQI